jgi:hypothetical protein
MKLLYSTEETEKYHASLKGLVWVRQRQLKEGFEYYKDLSRYPKHTK